MSTKEKKDAKYTRKLKYGTMATVITAIVIAIVIIINIIMGVLMKRYPVKLDLTTDKRYELCDETVDFLKNMDKDVEIAVMYPEETLAQYTYYNMIPKILEKYEVYAKAGKGSVDVKYYDITKDPDVVSKYSKYYNGTISQGSVVVYCDEKVKVSNVTSYITTDSSSNSYYQQSSNNNYIFIGESTITSAIMSVTDANPKKAGLMLYMGEKSYVFSDMSYYSVSQLYSLMNSNGYECTELNILSDDFTECILMLFLRRKAASSADIQWIPQKGYAVTLTSSLTMATEKYIFFQTVTQWTQELRTHSLKSLKNRLNTLILYLPLNQKAIFCPQSFQDAHAFRYPNVPRRNAGQLSLNEAMTKIRLTMR